MTDEELIAKLRDLTAKATTGLGTWSVCTGDLIAVDYNDETPWFIARGPSCESDRLTLAAEAVNALPHLLDRIDALTAALHEIEKMCLTTEKINLVGKSPDAALAGTLRSVMATTRTALEKQP
jgi:hypothetical protein